MLVLMTITPSDAPRPLSTAPTLMPLTTIRAYQDKLIIMMIRQMMIIMTTSPNLRRPRRPRRPRPPRSRRPPRRMIKIKKIKKIRKIRGLQGSRRLLNNKYKNNQIKDHQTISRGHRLEIRPSRSPRTWGSGARARLGKLISKILKVICAKA